MADVATEVPAAAAAKTKKPRAPKGQGKPKKASTHPPVNDMVVAAIKTLKERGGSSLQAIKKYMAANYMCDVAKLAPFIKKALKSGVEKGKLVQTKGTGASGSFKLTAEAKAEKKKAKKSTPAGAKKAKAATAAGKKKATAATKKKPTGADKKAVAAKKPKAKKSSEKKAKKVAPKQKATKPSKTAAKKPKVPKPKKAVAPAKKAAKK